MNLKVVIPAKAGTTKYCNKLKLTSQIIRRPSGKIPSITHPLPIMHNAPDEIESNCSDNEHFSDVLAINQKRRQLLQGGFSLAATALLAGTAGCARTVIKPGAAQGLAFQAVPASKLDIVSVPSGYSAQLLYGWGDAISDGPAMQPDASDSAETQMQQAGMHHDGMHFFPFPGKANHGVLAMNHEYTDDGLLHTGGMTPWTAEKVAKSKAAHGVSVIEVKLENQQWKVVRPSRFGRRISADTLMQISGPAAASEYLKTSADPSGTRVLGTLNNCANGYTPWGTYLTCEENWSFYFVNSSGNISDREKRYGITPQGLRYRWHEHDERFDSAKHPNEVNRFGWVVEIDPFDPTSTPIKRTALGRCKHEGATTRLASDGRVAVYMGDDERFEYIYKFVSRDRFDAAHPKANRNLLDHGTLYVAKFNAGGSGDWLELTHGKNGLTSENGFADQADVLVRTRTAADRVGATKMDRPEWVAVHPQSGAVFITCTNNSKRTADNVNAANNRIDNSFGHIISWLEDGADAAATNFQWQVFVACGDPSLAKADKKGNIKGDLFACPDGLCFDPQGFLWIATDVFCDVLNNGEFVNFGNNQLLAADTQSGEIKRFLTGPVGCEITGPVFTPDGRSLFVNIQHPGENPNMRSDPANAKVFSSWPDGDKGNKPRSATIVIRKDDGGVIGS